MSSRVVYTCVYGRHKPGKVHKQFQGDGKIFLTGREMVLVCDDSKDEIGRAFIPPHKDISSGKEYVVGGYDVQLGDEYDGQAEPPPAPEPVTKKLKAFKAPAVSPAGGSRVHPYASSAGSRFVRRGGFQSADVKEEDEDGDRKPLITRNHLVSAAEVAAAEKPEAKKTKYSLF